MQHAVVSPDEWLNARRELLKAEKEVTHLSDKVAKERLALPWVRMEKEYVFDTLDGPRSLADLFDGRSQFWCSISCSHRDGRKAARVVPSWPTPPMA